jgi:hypothetical protein
VRAAREVRQGLRMRDCTSSLQAAVLEPLGGPLQASGVLPAPLGLLGREVRAGPHRAALHASSSLRSRESGRAEVSERTGRRLAVLARTRGLTD